MKEKDQESIETLDGEKATEENTADADFEIMEEVDDDDDEDEDDDDDAESIIEMLREEKAELNRRLLRAHADHENLRKRGIRERQESVKYANKSIFLSMLNVLDNFDRALDSAADPKDNFVIGVAMIHKQLMEVLSQSGVEPIQAINHPFDPHRHEALAREESDEHEDNTVIEEFQKGYTYNGTLLRPSKVKVSMQSAEEAEENETEADSEESTGEE